MSGRLKLFPIIDPRDLTASPPWDRRAAQERHDDLADYADLFGCHEGTALATDLATYKRALGFADNLLALPTAPSIAAEAGQHRLELLDCADAFEALAVKLRSYAAQPHPAQMTELAELSRKIAAHCRYAATGGVNAA